MSIHIALVTATFPPYHGGTGNVCYANARELARRGHDVHVFTARLRGTAAQETSDGFSVHRLRPAIRLGNASLLPGLLPALGGFDLIHVHCPFILGAELTALAAATRGTPLVVTYHNDLIDTGTWRDVLFHLAAWSSHQTIYRQADRLLFVSQGHAQTCALRGYLGKGRDLVLPNGIDTQLFRPNDDRAGLRAALGLPNDIWLIGFVGGLDRAHHYKGLQLLLDALATPLLGNAHLLVIGDGALRGRYEQQSHELELGERVHFYGAATSATLPSLYAACNVLAVPSLVAESFGLVAAEALACGVPVVASDGPGIRELVHHGKNGLLVAQDDVGALTEALQQLLCDDEHRLAMGRQGRADIVANYDWETIGERLEAIYHQVLHERELAARSHARGYR